MGNNRFHRVLLSMLSVIFVTISFLLFLAIVGIFFTPAITTEKIVLLLFKFAVVFLATMFIFFMKKAHLKEPEKNPRKKRLILKITALIVIISIVGFQVLNKDIDKAVGNHKFNLLTWETKTLLSQLTQAFIINEAWEANTPEKKITLVSEFFDLASAEQQLLDKAQRKKLHTDEAKELGYIVDRREKIQNEVETIISTQIQSVLEEYGIRNPANKSALFFPPVWFNFQLPPKFLTISYRDKLELKHSVLINSNVSVVEVDKIEAAIETLGHSAYIKQPTGISLFPTIVSPSSLKNRLRTITHEWIHIYITFTPLGLARIYKNTNERYSIEETVATIVGNEIGNAVWEKYYAPYQDTPKPQSPRKDTRIDFNEAMREIRQQVEKLLADGKIKEAESYMQERRDWLETEGHYVRKLNQAYFVLYGFYATNPAYQDAQGGLGAKLLELREKTSSLKEFLDIVSNIKNLEDLKEVLEKLTSRST